MSNGDKVVGKACWINNSSSLAYNLRIVLDVAMHRITSQLEGSIAENSVVNEIPLASVKSFTSTAQSFN